jgi:ABC-2 type transport system permease protein
MTDQIGAILWAQFRSIRNMLPRTNVGTVLAGLVSLIWYGSFASVALALASVAPHVPLRDVHRFLPVVLLGILLFWQIFPLMTLSSGWSIELNKLLIYPIREETLFSVEVLLRVTTSPEMIIVLLGLIVGLMRHPELSPSGPVLLLFYLPLNLLLSLGTRELVRRLLSRERLKALLLILFLIVSVLPSLVFNTGLGESAKPFLIGAASIYASLSLGDKPLLALSLCCAWIVAAYVFARAEFSGMIAFDQASPQPANRGGRRKRGGQGWPEIVFRLPAKVFRDPLAALIEKELRVLSRSPRFRLLFGMACAFSVVVFFPLAFGRASSAFLRENYLPSISAYGLLIVGETLLWNMFGFDRRAAQIYFVAPVRLATVVLAKNIVATAAIALMTILVSVAGSFFRTNPHYERIERIAESVVLTLVLTVFFLAFGNFMSVLMPRPVDPNQAMRTQGSAKASALVFLCALMVIIPVGLAFAARWAFDADWPFFAVLACDLLAGLAFYYVVTETAIERAENDRERILELLSRESGPIGM